MVSKPMSRLQALFADLTDQKSMPLEEIYTPAVSFEDPFHKIEGRDELQAYFERLNENVKTCTFEFHDVYENTSGGVVTWTMRLELRRGPRGPIVVEGASHLRYEGEQIAYHRDYFDGADLVYEHVPLLGAAIRQIKKRM